MKLTVEVPHGLEERLAKLTQRMNVAPESLAEAALRDLLARGDEEFERAVQRVLDKNDELYRRLA